MFEWFKRNSTRESEVCGFVDKKGLFHKTKESRDDSNNEYDFYSWIDSLCDDTPRWERGREMLKDVLFGKDATIEVLKKINRKRLNLNLPII